MSNEIKIRTDAVPTVPGDRNVFERYADGAGGGGGVIIGQLLKFSKGDWIAGRDGEELENQELVAVVPGLLCGWVHWENSSPIEQVMGPLSEGFVPPRRAELGYTDPAKWETDAAGKRRDPWQESVYLPMISLDAESVFTFTTSSDGGRRHAIGPLCREYGSHIRQKPGELPIVKLGQDSYLHSDRSIGRVKYPLFPIERWIDGAKYLDAVAAVAGRSIKLLENA
jgi:hypothetical protein